MWKTSGRIKTERLTAVLQDGEKCGGYTFLARKKNKINRKLTASEARHLVKPQNVGGQLTTKVIKATNQCLEITK